MLKKIHCSQVHQQTASKPSLIKIAADVKAKRSRKKSAVSVMDSEQEWKERVARRLRILAAPEIVDDFPCGRDLAIAERKRKIEMVDGPVVDK